MNDDGEDGDYDADGDDDGPWMMDGGRQCADGARYVIIAKNKLNFAYVCGGGVLASVQYIAASAAFFMTLRL